MSVRTQFRRFVVCSIAGLVAVTSSPLSVEAQECPHAKQARLAAEAQVQAHAVSATTAPVEAADIVDTAVSAGSFNTLVAAVKAAGLVETLKGEGPFTVFAPTDDAFAKVPAATLQELLKPENKEQLQAILTYHVVSGKVMAADVQTLSSATTVQGGDVKISAGDGTVMINDAKVVTADIECTNGVIHVIDTVIMPPAKAPEVPATVEHAATAPAATADIVDTAAGAGKFTTLVAAIKAAGLVETLKGEGPFTVFAPSDEAFGKLPASAIQALLEPGSKDKLASILTYHVVAGKVMAADVVELKSAKTVNGQEVAIKVEDGTVTIDGAKVVTTDIQCKNGVIHIIDSVIMPK